MKKYTYTGSKIQNHFTAYLMKFVQGKRYEYLEKKIQTAEAEESLEDIGQMEPRVVFEELMENRERDRLLLRETEGRYPEWNKLADVKLVEAMRMLSAEERKLIYQHVFEERSFKEMSVLNEVSEKRCKAVYYYAIRKIRKAMGGDK